MEEVDEMEAPEEVEREEEVEKERCILGQGRWRWVEVVMMLKGVEMMVLLVIVRLFAGGLC